MQPEIVWILTLYNSEKYLFVAQQFPFSLHKAVISPYNNLDNNFKFLSYLTFAGIIA